MLIFYICIYEFGQILTHKKVLAAWMVPCSNVHATYIHVHETLFFCNFFLCVKWQQNYWNHGHRGYAGTKTGREMPLIWFTFLPVEKEKELSSDKRMRALRMNVTRFFSRPRPYHLLSISQSNLVFGIFEDFFSLSIVISFLSNIILRISFLQTQVFQLNRWPFPKNYRNL